MLKITDLMTNKVISINQGNSVEKAALLMNKNKISSIIILDKKKTIGIITEKDLANKIVAKNLLPSKVKVEDIITTEIIGVSHNSSIPDVCKEFKEHQIKKLLVYNNKKLVGIISITDILNKLT